MGREEGPRRSGVDWAASGNSELVEQKVHGAVTEWCQRSKLTPFLVFSRRSHKHE